VPESDQYLGKENGDGVKQASEVPGWVKPLLLLLRAYFIVLVLYFLGRLVTILLNFTVAWGLSPLNRYTWTVNLVVVLLCLAGCSMALFRLHQGRMSAFRPVAIAGTLAGLWGLQMLVTVPLSQFMYSGFVTQFVFPEISLAEQRWTPLLVVSPLAAFAAAWWVSAGSSRRSSRPIAEPQEAPRTDEVPVEPAEEDTPAPRPAFGFKVAMAYGLGLAVLALGFWWNLRPVIRIGGDSPNHPRGWRGWVEEARHRVTPTKAKSEPMLGGGLRVGPMKQAPDRPARLALSGNGNVAVFLSPQEELCVLDLNRDELRSFTLDAGEEAAVLDVDPEGEYALLSAHRGSVLAVVDLGSGQISYRREAQGWFQDGRLFGDSELLMLDGGRVVRCVDWKRGGVRWEVQADYHDFWTGSGILPSRDGRLIACGQTRDWMIDWREGKLLGSVFRGDCGTRPVAVFWRGGYVPVEPIRGGFAVDPVSPSPARFLVSDPGYASSPGSIGFPHWGKFALGIWGRLVAVWDFETSGRVWEAYGWDEGIITSADVSNDGRVLTFTQGRPAYATILFKSR